MNWLLPEHIADALPREAAQIEILRRRLLDLFRTHGYELVMPPLLEYLDSLLTGAGQDLQLRTFKIVDQLSGKTMGVRADMTPQVTRIDAHLLNRQGVSRLCYCDSVLHTLPASMTATREPIQAGVELYGYAGFEADLEIVQLMEKSLRTVGLRDFRIDLGHVGIFKSLMQLGQVTQDLELELFAALQSKDVTAVTELAKGLPALCREGLIVLPKLYGAPSVLLQARQILPNTPEICSALDTLEKIASVLATQPISVDLADLRGYHYHSGMVFAAYTPGFAGAIALGGRYDGVGKAFGSARPATGFSLDLRELARLSPIVEQTGAIQAPADASPDLLVKITNLRQQGEIIVCLLPGERLIEGPRCDRRLVRVAGEWTIESL